MAYTYGSVTKCKVGNGTTRNEYECRLGYQVNSQSIADNTSNVTLRLEVRSISSSYGTYGYNQTTKIDGTSLSAKSFDMRSTNTWQVFGSRTITVTHNASGSYSASKSGSFTTTATGTYSLKSGSASVTVAPAKIPRYGTSNQSLNSKTETTIKMNWSSDSTVDYLWYSVNNGSSWTGVDVTDGTSGTYNITGLTPNTAYNIKTRIRRKDSQLTTDSTALAVTTYKAPSNSLKSKTETSVTVNWSCDSTADYIWYSKDNGSNWVGVGGVSTTSGSYTISGLSVNTSYNIKTRVRRKATQTTYDTSTLSVTTYDYPYCTDTPNFIIGDIITLKFYNPLGRSFEFYIIANGTQINTTYYCSSTSYTGIASTETSVPYLYATIPNAKSGKYQVKVVYGSSTKTRNNGNTYSIRGTEKPVFTNFTYKDTNTTVSTILGTDQYLVKGLSNLKVIIPSANKMVGLNSATPKNYIATLENLNKSANYSTSDVTLDLGTPINAGTKRLTVTAYDNRGLYTSAYKDVIIFDYAKPVINIDVKRLNNFEAETTLKVNGTYSRIIIDGTDKNSITKVQYRYRETGGTWSSWTNLSTTLTSGKFTCNDVVLSLDNNKSFEFQVQAVDNLGTNNLNASLDVGQAIFFISSNKKQCYINGELVKGSLEVSSIEPTNGEEVWIQKTKNLAKVIDTSKTDGGVTFTPVSTSELEVKGTTTSNIYVRIIPSLNLKANRTYTISINYDTSGSFFLYTNKYANIGLGYGDLYVASTRVKTFTPKQDGEIDLVLYADKGLTINHNLQIQVEESPTATEYEPYVDKKIYCKNNSGEYEEFINAETIGIKTVTSGNNMSILYPDGTMITSGTFYSSGITTNEWGNSYASRIENPLTFPANFTKVYSVNVNCVDNTNAFWVHRVVFDTTKITAIEVSRPSVSSNGSAYFSYTAIGKWK